MILDIIDRRGADFLHQNVSLNDAVVWAKALPEAVTLFLYHEARGISVAQDATKRVRAHHDGGTR